MSRLEGQLTATASGAPAVESARYRDGTMGAQPFASSRTVRSSSGSSRHWSTSSSSSSYTLSRAAPNSKAEAPASTPSFSAGRRSTGSKAFSHPSGRGSGGSGSHVAPSLSGKFGGQRRNAALNDALLVHSKRSNSRAADAAAAHPAQPSGRPAAAGSGTPTRPGPHWDLYGTPPPPAFSAPAARGINSNGSSSGSGSSSKKLASGVNSNGSGSSSSSGGGSKKPSLGPRSKTGAGEVRRARKEIDNW